MALEITGTRTTSSVVSFLHPFRVGHDPRELPAGSYTLHTYEDVFEGAFEPVYVARSADLIVEDIGRTVARIVSPGELAEALQRDQARSNRLP